MSSPARSPRDLGLDLLRGYFLFVIVIDHVGSFPSVFELVTGRGQLWASAAEGFVLVSGYLVGWLRGPVVARGDLTGATRKLLRRAATLVVWSIGLTFFFTAVARLGGYAPAIGMGVDSGTPASVVWKTLTLQYSYGLHDMLPMYAVCLAVSPLVLWALVRGWGWAVAPVSVALWLVALRSAEPLLLSGFFSIASWQMLFFAGVFLGFYSDRVRAQWERVPRKWRTALLVAGTVLTAATMVASYARLPSALPSAGAATASGAPAPTRLHPILFSKTRLGPGRIGVAGLWLFTLYALVKRFEPKLMKALGWLLIPLGQRSLYVYIVQALLLFAVIGHTTNHLLLASAIGASAVAIIWWMIRIRFLYRVIPN